MEENDFRKNLRRAFEDGEDARNMHTYEDLATIMAYLLELEPSFEK